MLLVQIIAATFAIRIAPVRHIDCMFEHSAKVIPPQVLAFSIAPIKGSDKRIRSSREEIMSEEGKGERESEGKPYARSLPGFCS